MVLSYCISNSKFSMLVYTKAIDLCPATLLYLTISFRFCVHVNFWEFYIQTIILSANKVSFIPSLTLYLEFPFFIPFFFLVLAVPSSTVLNKNSERGDLSRF